MNIKSPKKNSDVGILDPEGNNLNPLNSNSYSQNYKTLSEKWRVLPAYEKSREIIDTIKKNQIVLITSGTGSGKTVLIPKFCLHALDYKESIIVTLPKQIIAKKAAEYSAKTLDVKIGEHVGYQFRGSNKKKRGKNPNLLYATDGTVVSKLLSDPLLEDYKSVIIDEAHERKIQIDLLLFLLKNLLKKRPDFKVIIMSATIDHTIFQNYYKGFLFKHLNVSGKTNFEIKSTFLEKPLQKEAYLEKGLSIIQDLIKKDPSKETSIIFFVPSISETVNACNTLAEKLPDIYCVSVYSGITREMEEIAQDKLLFSKVYPEKTKKVVISTNVAESSLTIDGAKYVIDCGYEIDSSYDPETNSDVLSKRFITKAQAKQRMGRTGRTEPGECFHLYTKKEFDAMREFPEPMILKSNLYNEMYKLFRLKKGMDIKKIESMLTEFIEPPQKKYIKKAVDILKEIKIVNRSSLKLSHLGENLLGKPVDPMEGCTIYYAQKTGCAREVIIILAMISLCKGNISDFFIPEKLGQKEKIKLRYRIKGSDHLTLLNIYNSYDKESREFNHLLFSKVKKKIRLMKGHFHFKHKNMGRKTSRDIIKAFYYSLPVNTGVYISSKKKIRVSYLKKSVDIDYNSSVLSVMQQHQPRIVYSTMVKRSDKLSVSIVSILS